jgi:hypothetical protein
MVVLCVKGLYGFDGRFRFVFCPDLVDQVVFLFCFAFRVEVGRLDWDSPVLGPSL